VIHSKTWSDDMTDEEKHCYQVETKVLQLIDHVTSGAQDIYSVHDQYSGYGGFSYAEALEKFNSLTTPGYCYIYLATRIGTGVTIKEKTNP
jgi:hypothetical protein